MNDIKDSIKSLLITLSIFILIAIALFIAPKHKGYINDIRSKTISFDSSGIIYYKISISDIEKLITLSDQSFQFWAHYYGLNYDLAYRVATIETGHFKSHRAVYDNNLFGMFYSRNRQTTGNKMFGDLFASYSSFIMSIKDFKLFDDEYGVLRMINSGAYAGDTTDNYIHALLSVKVPVSTIQFDTTKINNQTIITIKGL